MRELKPNFYFILPPPRKISGIDFQRLGWLLLSPDEVIFFPLTPSTTHRFSAGQDFIRFDHIRGVLSRPCVFHLAWQPPRLPSIFTALRPLPIRPLKLLSSSPMQAFSCYEVHGERLKFRPVRSTAALNLDRKTTTRRTEGNVAKLILLVGAESTARLVAEDSH